MHGFKIAGKSWTALIGSLLAIGIPLILEISTSLDPQWQAIIGGAVALLTAVGVYHAPYQPVARKEEVAPQLVVAPPLPPLPPPSADNASTVEQLIAEYEAGQ